jgi:hypothetical protein
LLLAGALTFAVSVYRLVESQWQLIPVMAQYLVLVAAALGVYGVGELTLRRLRLPLAGSALLLLFTALVPVLSWGAVFLDLLTAPFGWLAFAVGSVALLAASRRPLRLILGYHGLLYPATLALFVVAQPVLPELVRLRPDLTGSIYLAAAFLLGVALHLGSRHINRFFFHRDRFDRVERPVEWIPFLVLGAFYLGAMVLLDPRSELTAIPLVVIGIVLTTTGEEYYRALVRSLGAKPDRWPKRSVALMTIGIAAMVVAFPLSLIDPSLRCSAMVSVFAAAFFIRWSVRSPSIGTHLLALGSTFAAYHLFPVLVPELAKQLWARLLDTFGLTPGSPLAFSIADLGFLVGLVVWSGLLRRTGASGPLRTIHATISVVYLWCLAALAMADPVDPSWYLVILSGVGCAGVVASRCRELVLGVYFTLSALVLTVAQRVLGEPHFLTSPTLLVLGVATLLATLATRALDRPLDRVLQIGESEMRRLFSMPAVVVAAAIAVWALAFEGLTSGFAGVQLLFAGATLVAAGERLRARSLPAIGGVLAATGLHVVAFDLLGGVTPPLVILTQGLAVLSLWCTASASRREGPMASFIRPAASALAVFHVLLGLHWLLYGATHWDLTVEPVILAILGLVIADLGLMKRSRAHLVLGGLTLGVFAQLQLLVIAEYASLAVAVPASLIAFGLALAPMILLARIGVRGRLARAFGLEPLEFHRLVVAAVDILIRFWTIVSVAACLMISGPTAGLLAATAVALVLMQRLAFQRARNLSQALPLRLGLVLVLQVLILVNGTPHDLMPLALAAAGFDLLPLTAVLVLGWRALVDGLGRRRELLGWSLTVEGLLAVFVLSAFLAHPALSAGANAGVIVVSLALSALHARAAFISGAIPPSWAAQIWVGLTVVHGFTAGWLHLVDGTAPWVLLAIGVTEYSLAALLARTEKWSVLGVPCRHIGLSLPLVAWALAIARLTMHPDQSVWATSLPAFGVSLFYAVVSLRESRSTGAGILAAATFCWTLLEVLVRSGLGFEFYFLAPGVSLMGIAYLLRPRIGRAWSRHLATAGASLVYATPIAALTNQVSWIWLAVLLLMTVIFGSACVVLRSRSLLTVSTAALLTDLGFFVFKIGTTEPMLLWVFGLAFGLALMATAAYLEYQREGLLQQVRVFGRELKSWH